MFGLPMEAVTLLFSTLLGAGLRLWADSRKDRQEQQKLLLQRFSASEDSVQSARNYQNPNAQWIRRFLVICFMSMAAFILLAPVLGFNTVVPVEVTEGFKFLFIDTTKTVTEFVSLDGMVTPAWLPHSINAVVGFYFGQSLVRR